MSVSTHCSFQVVFKVFEANIRLLGSLLSAHLLMEDPNFPGLAPDWYLEDLLRFGTVGNVDATNRLI